MMLGLPDKVPRRKNKYGARPQQYCCVCGHYEQLPAGGVCPLGCGDLVRMDSLAELRRYDELRLMQRIGLISGLLPHPRYPIILYGVQVGTYVADNRYTDFATGALVVEDVKGGTATATDTALSKFKRRCVAAQYGIDVVVVRR